MDLAPVCPKCGTSAAPEGDACRRCGLRRALWADFAAEEPLPFPALDEAWQKLLATWSDPGAHDRFLVLARALAALDAAAARYRRHLHDHSDDATARRALEQLSLVAMQHQAELPREGLRGARTLYWVTLVIGVLLFAGVGTFVWKLAAMRAD